MLAIFKKKESYEEKHYLLIFTICTYISALFLPLVVVYIAQDAIYHSKSHWFFATPFTAYITFGVGMLWIAVVLTIFLIFRNMIQKIWFRVATVLLVLCSIPAFVLAIQNYYYFDDEGLHYNELYTVNQLDIGWSDVKKMTQVNQVKDGTLYLVEYRFETKEGSTIVVPNEEKIREWRRYMNQNLEANNVPIENIEIEPKNSF